MRERRHEDVPEPREDGGSWLDWHRLGRRADRRATRAVMDNHEPLLKDPVLAVPATLSARIQNCLRQCQEAFSFRAFATGGSSRGMAVPPD
jgi:hypothetical protein